MRFGCFFCLFSSAFLVLSQSEDSYSGCPAQGIYPLFNADVFKPLHFFFSFASGDPLFAAFFVGNFFFSAIVQPGGEAIVCYFALRACFLAHFLVSCARFIIRWECFFRTIFGE